MFKEVIYAIELVLQPPKGFSSLRSKNLRPSPAELRRYLLQGDISSLLRKSVCPESEMTYL